MRWKFVIPALILIVLVAGFNILFLDVLLKRAVIAGGEAAFGARVEIASLKTRFNDLSVVISGFAVADKNDVWKNLFEADRIAFGLKPLPLLSKKFIIEEMSMDGVRWGTKRSISGKLSPRKIKKIEKKNTKEDKNSLSAKLLAKLNQQAREEVAAMPAVETIRDAGKSLKDISVDKMINVADLDSLNAMDSAQRDIQQKYAAAQSRLNEIKIDERIARALAAANEAAQFKISGVQDIEPARKKIEVLNQSRQEMEKAVADIQSLKGRVVSDIGDEKELAAKIAALKDKDYQNIASKLKLPSMSLGNVSQAVFGPVWINRVNDVMYYMHLARKYMPQRAKQQTVVVQQRMKGVDVRFPLANRHPDLLINKISLNGTTGGAGKEGAPLDFMGVITDITSDPALLGRPTKIEIRGEQGGRKLSLKGTFDHTADIADDSLDIIYAGLSAQELKLPESGYFPSMEKGAGNVTAHFQLKGDQIAAGVNLALEGLSYAAGADINDEVRGIIASLWAGISSITVEARITGTSDDLSVSVSSNIDKVLSDRLKNLYGAKAAEIQSKVRAEIDRLTSQKQKELMAEYSSRKESLLKEYASKEKEARDAAGGVQAQLEQKENAIREQGGREKQKAEEELRKKASEKLKEIFR